ncbi:MAG TPA: NADH-quinone oxidoreductase subunit M [Planctomycetaceae bacterium]|nr:NADH-quinone oxidoreductase subunit M [Planctomycetaceae bacterium]
MIGAFHCLLAVIDTSTPSGRSTLGLLGASLVATIVIPIAVGALLLIAHWPARFARWLSLTACVATLACGIGLAASYDSLPARSSQVASAVQPRLQLGLPWLSYGRGHGVPYGKDALVHLEFQLGLDGISLSLILLTSLLTFSAVLISWLPIHDREREYYAALLILMGALNGAFCAFDLVLFYVFFEFTLLPLFFLVGIWGGPDRRHAAVKFFLYTFAGSIVTLAGIAYLVIYVIQHTAIAYPFSIPELAAALEANRMPVSLQVGLLLAISLGFAIKVPLFPFHTWLPLAHTEAPTAGSVVLAGVLLKLGAYGFLRICLPLFPDACYSIGTPLIGLLAVIGVIYGALCAYAQTDLKKLVAYSSISHLGFCMLGMFALNAEGITGSFLQIINHGLSTGAMFLLVGMVYERYHTREIPQLGGIASKLPLISAAMVFTCLASMGLPGLNGFVGEFLALIGMFKANKPFAVVATFGVILAALYLLSMLRRAFFGPVGTAPMAYGHVGDLRRAESWAVVPLMILCLVIGLYPKPLIDIVKPDVQAIARLYDARRFEQNATPVALQEVRR